MKLICRCILLALTPYAVATIGLADSLYITADGVGIGTSTPSDDFEVNGTATFDDEVMIQDKATVIGSGSNGETEVKNNRINFTFPSGASYIAQTGNQALVFKTGTPETNRMLIHNDGVLEVREHIEVAGSGSNGEAEIKNNRINFTFSSGSSYIVQTGNQALIFRTGSPEANRVLIHNDGVLEVVNSIGVGTSDPQEALDVQGDVVADDYLYNSDVRLKTNIQQLHNSLDRLARLKGVSYEAAADDEPKTRVGIVAQDVEKVYPEVVTTDARGGKSVAYARLIAPIIEAIKELKDRVDDMESRLFIPKNAGPPQIGPIEDE